MYTSDILSMDSVDLKYLLSLNSIENICRVCLLQEGSISLLATAVQNMVEVNIQDIFEAFTDTQVQENDKLPQHICSSCFMCLLKSNEFIMKCKRSNSLLYHVQSLQKHKSSSESWINDFRGAIKITSEAHESTCDQKLSVKRLIHTNDSLVSPSITSKSTSVKRCGMCPKVCKSQHALRHHLILHSKEKSFKYKSRSKRFSNLYNLLCHFMSDLGEKPYNCDMCCKAFYDGLKVYQKDHMHIKHYCCSVCNKMFHQMSEFKTHLEMHKGFVYKNTKVICAMCNKVLSSKSALCNHMLIHSMQKFLCNLCGVKFSQKGSFLHHYRSHTGERPFACDVCPKTFSYKHALKVHKYVHTGDKPYTCSKCGKMFTQPNNLKRHIRYHMGTKPYICEYCDKKFVEKGNLTVHIRIHTGERPYVCSVCNESFCDSSSLKKHKRGHEENNKKTVLKKSGE